MIGRKTSTWAGAVDVRPRPSIPTACTAGRPLRSTRWSPQRERDEAPQGAGLVGAPVEVGLHQAVDDRRVEQALATDSGGGEGVERQLAGVVAEPARRRHREAALAPVDDLGRQERAERPARSRLLQPAHLHPVGEVRTRIRAPGRRRTGTRASSECAIEGPVGLDQQVVGQVGHRRRRAAAGPAGRRARPRRSGGAGGPGDRPRPADGRDRSRVSRRREGSS